MSGSAWLPQRASARIGCPMPEIPPLSRACADAADEVIVDRVVQLAEDTGPATVRELTTAALEDGLDSLRIVKSEGSSMR